MFGEGVGDLRVETKDSDNGYLWNTTWSISGNQDNVWNPASITVDGSDYVVSTQNVDSSMELYIENLANKTYQGSHFLPF